jgi:hypothetical protein
MKMQDSGQYLSAGRFRADLKFVCIAVVGFEYALSVGNEMSCDKTMFFNT